MLLLVGILAPSLLLLRPSYKQLVGGGGGRLPLERSVDALLQLPEQGSGLLFQDSKKAMTAQAEHERVLIEPNMSPIVERKRSRKTSAQKAAASKRSGGAKGGGFGAGRSSPMQRATELRCETMADDGVCCVPGVLTAEAAAQLRECVSDELRSAYAAVEDDPLNCKERFNVPVETMDPLRGYLLLPLRDELSVSGGVDRGPMVSALSKLLEKDSALGELFASTCGGRTAEWYDLVALRTEPGAARQPLHSDTPYQKVPGLFCAFIALQDVPFSMGSTLFVPGTHKNTKDRKAILDLASYADGRRDAALGSVESRYTMLKAGDAAFFDMRTLHAGTANFAAADGGSQRLILALTFRNRKATQELGHAPNLRPNYRDRGITLSDLQGELLTDAPFAGLAGDGDPYGDGLAAP